jgi:hypothetical protein
MSDIRLDEYYSAGYILIQKSPRPNWLDEPEGLVPHEMISLESNLAPKFHLSWGWQMEDRTPALRFGIDGTKWVEFEKWCADHLGKDIDIWSMFHSSDSIRSFITQFILPSHRERLVIVGAGLHQSCESDWQDPYETEGVEIQLLKHLPLEKSGQILGFDVASYAHHDFDHTWFSHLHHRGVFQELGIRPGQYGLLQSREEAIAARNYTDAHDGYSYEYWLLVEYPF